MQDWNDDDLARFRALIEARLRVLSDDTARGRGGEAAVTLDQQAIGRLSRMDALQNQAMARAQQARRAAEAARLAAALDRIDSGDYGHCDGCGDPIAARRLDLDLAATRCVACLSGAA